MWQRAPARAIRLAVVAVIIVSASRCESPDEGAAGLEACTHIDSAKKALDTFLQNHPIDGTTAPQSQITVLGDLVRELTSASAQDPPPQLVDAIRQAIGDAGQMQTDIDDGKPVRNGDLISDFDNLASLCGQLRSSDLVAP